MSVRVILTASLCCFWKQQIINLLNYICKTHFACFQAKTPAGCPTVCFSAQQKEFNGFCENEPKGWIVTFALMR